MVSDETMCGQEPARCRGARAAAWVVPLGAAIWVALGAAPGRATAQGVVPSFVAEWYLALDSTSAPAGSGLHDGTGLGVGMQLEGSLLGLLVAEGEPPEGFFVRDALRLDFAIGPIFGDDTAGLFLRAFVEAGLRVGAGSRESAFYVAPRIFTGFDTSRSSFGPGSGAGRWAFVVALGAAFQGFGIEAGYGAGEDTQDEGLNVLDVRTYVRIGERGVLTHVFLNYQGNFGDVSTEHDVGLGIGARY